MADSKLLSGDSADAQPEISGWMAGEYRLGRKLGEGGFGAVYEAVHPLLKRRAAVKVLHRIAGADSDAVLRFVAEARAVNQIRNRHIIDIFSFGKLPDGRHFYVMDLLEGETLDRYLKREGRLDVDRTVRLLRPIAEALDAAHAAGVVHRDLKPQNIYLVWDERGVTVPKLLDFGMAKLLGESPVHTQSGTPLGTPLYMSPEQARGDRVDGRSDVYALGVLVYELLTGRQPITGENTIAVLMAHIIQAPPRMSELEPEVPTELDEPVARMLEKKPEARPETASAALAELTRVAEAAGLSISEGPPSLSRPPVSIIPEGDFGASASADTAVQSFPPSLAGSEPHVGAAVVRTAKSAPSKRSLWPLWGLLVVLGAFGTYFLSRGGSARVREATSTAPVNAPSPRLIPVVSAAPPVEPSRAPAAAPSETAAPVVSLHEAAQKPKKKVVAASPSARVPSDLESPF